MNVLRAFAVLAATALAGIVVAQDPSGKPLRRAAVASEPHKLFRAERKGRGGWSSSWSWSSKSSKSSKSWWSWSTDTPTEFPTVQPTESPTVYPTDSPTVYPTDSPTVYPTDSPTWCWGSWSSKSWRRGLRSNGGGNGAEGRVEEGGRGRSAKGTRELAGHTRGSRRGRYSKGARKVGEPGDADEAHAGSRKLGRNVFDENDRGGWSSSKSKSCWSSKSWSSKSWSSWRRA